MQPDTGNDGARFKSNLNMFQEAKGKWRQFLKLLTLNRTGFTVCLDNPFRQRFPIRLSGYFYAVAGLIFGDIAGKSILIPPTLSSDEMVVKRFWNPD